MKTVNMMVKKNSHQTNKQKRDRNPPYKQDRVLLFTVNEDNWPIRRVYLSHVAIVMQIVVYYQRSPAHQNISHPSSMVLIFSKY